MTIVRSDEMAWNGRLGPLAVLTRWALLNAPYVGPQRIWYKWRYTTQGDALESVFMLPYKGRSVLCLYIRKTDPIVEERERALHGL